MSNPTAFLQNIQTGYQPEGDYLTIGTAMLEGNPVADALIKIPLKTLNRHGLIAGATGTGKTKTLQVLAENLSEKGIPVLLMDVKGDLSGLAVSGANHPKLQQRHQQIGIPLEFKGFPVEFLSLSQQEGVQLRATISEFGPALLARILELNETQESIVAVLFKYADDCQLPLLDLKDFKKLLQYATSEGKTEFETAYGYISTASAGAILRKMIELEQQGANSFLGEKSFEVGDLLRIDETGRGYINIVRLNDIQEKPRLFSTCMLSLLAEIYTTFPERGDSDRPELVFFMDEAHLLFEETSKTILQQLESIVRLIRSKGVGIYFITQYPTDIPEKILGQLGMKIQHALRAFTANDRKAIKLAAQNYPDSPYYNTEEALTSLGIGEALVTALDEKGRPTPLAMTMLRAPMSRMGVITPEELQHTVAASVLAKKYNHVMDRESAYELLNQKIKQAQQATEKTMPAPARAPEPKHPQSPRNAPADPLVKALTSATFIRGIFGMLTKMMR